MKKYIIVKREVWTSSHLVEAENKKQALELAAKSDCTELDGYLEFSHYLPVENWTIEETE